MIFVKTGMIISALAIFLSPVHVSAQDKKMIIATDTLPKLQTTKPNPPTLNSVKYDYYNHLGAACKVEFKLEQATKVPFRFRLGSLQQTDYLEQKPNAVKPQQ